MATLLGQLLKNTYAEVLKLNASRTSPPAGGNGLSSSLATVEDGKGVATPLSLSTTQISSSDLKSLQVATANRHSIRPSLLLDFVNAKHLDPRITFTRSHTNGSERSTYINSNGNMQTAAENEPRFDHDPVTLECKGFLLEVGRTNNVRNGQAVGSTVGVIGSGGAAPTFWAIAAGTSGVTNRVVGTGTENGINYIDIRISGTPTTTDAAYVFFEPTRTQIAASSGQMWTGSVYSKLAGGSTTNATVGMTVELGDSTGAYLNAATTSFTPTSASLITQRITRTVTTGTGTAGIRNFVSVSYTNGNAIDITLRIGAPQLESGGNVSSYIPTTSGAVARGSDVATLTPISSFFNPVEGTIFVDMIYTNLVLNATTNTWGSLLSFGATTTATPFIDIYAQWQSTAATSSGMGNGPFKYQDSTGVLSEAMHYGIPAAGTNFRYAGGYKQNDIASYRNGVLGVLGTADISAMTQLNRMGIGCLASNVIGSILNNHLRKIAYYPRRLTNAELQTLSTL
jgi:hypothetical protein